MNKRTPNQDKALQWYCEEKNLRIQLSSHPIYYFLDREGKEVTRNITNLTAEWEKQRDEAKKQSLKTRRKNGA